MGTRRCTTDALARAARPCSGGPSFSLLLKFTRHGPEYLESSDLAAWQEEYDVGHYYYKDPVLIWSLAATA